MDRVLLVFVGGGLGSALRYAVGLALARAFGTAFPFGTLAVNLAGCFAMAALMQITLQTSTLSPEWRLALGTGFLGGLTTYSSFNYETTRLAADGSPGLAVTNLLLTLFGCLVSGVLGAWLGRRLVA
jgi:CrcB protein